MSGGGRDLYHHSDLFFDDDVCSFFSHKPTIDGCIPQDIHSLSPPPVTPIMNFYDYGSFEKAFDMSPSSLPHLDAFSSGELCMDGGKNVNIPAAGGAGVTGTPTTPNSSVTWSSTEAAGDEKDQPKPEEEVMQLPAERNEDGGDDGSKKQSKPRKKGEKRTREPRFAFVTKSDVDHLEDGYRWRKYGQKAVKNSPYPRSYYRCTTQKCPVKKRVERSFQDPDTVITTYEGQHTHHSPATIRGSSHMLAPQPSLQSSYLHFPMMNQLHPMNNNGQQRQMMNPSMYLQNRPTTQQQLQLSDYGLLQDIVPSYVNNSQP